MNIQRKKYNITTSPKKNLEINHFLQQYTMKDTFSELYKFDNEKYSNSFTNTKN